MTHKSSNKKRILSRRKTNKLYQLGGVLSEIDRLIKNINNDDLSKLEKYADLMTIQQTYDLIKTFSVNNLDDFLRSASQYKTMLPTISFMVKNAFENYPNLIENIQKLITNLFPLSLEFLNTQYSTFPISKINPKLGKIYNNGKTVKIYDNEPYKLVGQGGFGSVYVNLDVNQAIKKISNLDSELFKSEALNYNNISSLVCNTNYFCKFKNCFIDTNLGMLGTLFVLMEYCGKDLITSIKELKKSQDLSFKTLLQWFITIAKGIQCMHDNGYVHLDIKPPNITIDNNEAKLIDFGLAHNISDIQEQLYMGTLDFMAPEMANNIEGIDYKICDIYSLGMTFAHCIAISLTKKRLSDEENTEEDEDEEDLEDKYDDKETLLSCIGLESMLSEEPRNRPTIREVVKKLTSVSMDTVFEKMFNMYGYSIIADLHDAGFNPADLHDGGFNLLDIFKSGYNYGEIRDIYKKNKHSNLATLLNHCDKKREGFKRHISKDCTINTICSSNPQLPECEQPAIKRRSRKSSPTHMSTKKSKKSSGVLV